MMDECVSVILYRDFVGGTTGAFVVHVFSQMIP